MNKRLLIAVFAALLGSASLDAQNILVASNRSNSIEEFDTSGTWVRTFATTGPYGPVALARSPYTGEIFVTTLWASGPAIGQLTNRILRYAANGSFDVNWDAFTVVCPAGSQCPTTATQSLVFDPLGNLWVATAYGTDLSGPICILEYPAANLILPNPPAGPMSSRSAPRSRYACLANRGVSDKYRSEGTLRSPGRSSPAPPRITTAAAGGAA